MAIKNIVVSDAVKLAHNTESKAIYEAEGDFKQVHCAIATCRLIIKVLAKAKIEVPKEARGELLMICYRGANASQIRQVVMGKGGTEAEEAVEDYGELLD